jgi:methylmalonyl-CoA/ethylmalonyl-CoA epimerase
LRRFSGVFGEKRWRCYVFGNAGEHEYHGRPTTFSVRLALNDETPQMELLQPLAGDSIRRDWLAERGEGLHHIGVIARSFEQAVASMAALGCAVIHSGRGFGAEGDGAYANFDPIASLGMIVEVVEPPASMPEPDAIWP